MFRFEPLEGVFEDVSLGVLEWKPRGIEIAVLLAPFVEITRSATESSHLPRQSADEQRVVAERAEQRKELFGGAGDFEFAPEIEGVAIGEAG